MPLFLRTDLTEETITEIRAIFPGGDIYALKAEFDAWIADDATRCPKDYQAAFYGFVRQHHERENTSLFNRERSR